MSVLEEVRTAYSGDYGTRQLQFRASAPLRNDDPELHAALREIGQYNEFDGETAAESLHYLSCGVTVAREYSVCLYIQPLESRAGEIVPVLNALHADEIDVDTLHGVAVIRAWWD